MRDVSGDAFHCRPKHISREASEKVDFLQRESDGVECIVSVDLGERRRRRRI